MNKIGYQINERLCVVSSDNNSVMICSKDSNDYTFEDILNKENELDNLYENKVNNIKNLFRTNTTLRQESSGLLTLGCVDLLISSMNAEVVAASTIATELAFLLYSIKKNRDYKKTSFKNAYLKAKEDLKSTNKSIKELELELKNIKEQTNYNCEYNLLTEWYTNELDFDNYTEKRKLVSIKNYLEYYIKEELKEEITSENEIVLKKIKY